jgi:hypothetical protein
MSALMPRARVAPGGSLSPEARAQISSDDLVRLLLADGGQVLSWDEHGGFVQVHQRLIFIRRAPVVGIKDLLDALRAAEIGPGRFDILLERLRREPASALPDDATTFARRCTA